MRRASAVLTGLTLALLSSPAVAQAPPPEQRLGPPPFQYNFAPPGARSLAMGASFIGLADDATAAESNPAGLTILTKPEFSAHFRYTVFDNQVPDTVSGQGFDTFTSRVGSPSFFSVVYPWKKAALSVYYQRAADYRLESNVDGFLGDLIYNVDSVSSLLRVENIGLSGAVKLGDKISLGATVRATRARLEASQFVNLGYDSVFEDLGATQFGGSVEQTETKATFNAGLLVSPTSKFSIGAVYKKGADFDLRQSLRTSLRSLYVGPIDLTSSQAVALTVPDVFGGGLAIRPTDRFTIVADVIQIKYSDADPGPNAQNLYQRFGQGGYEALDDATEFHGGLEYTWTSGSDWIFSLRGGYYSDPDHDGLAGLDSKQDHFTFGGGVVVKNKLQVDGAVNIADAIKEGLISFVVRF